jgi:nucleotidyltransferase substrate binding protein (TIGR01987 family)
MDIRWKQRFQNFEMAFKKLQEAMELTELNELERNGLIQRFEFTLDLSWKVLKDFLEEQGFVFKPSPKDTIRLAQQADYIHYSQELIDGLEIRNILSHDYSGQKFLDSEVILRNEIFPAIQNLYHFFLEQINDATAKTLTGFRQCGCTLTSGV